ncbi:MAG: hypothetical protein HYY84_02505 [Deltaproteobacteria bacterium]|nr:hypothetical protein [Deltaproteobacteria bacterium]
MQPPTVDAAPLDLAFRAARLYHLSLAAAAIVTILHAVSVPVVITWDGQQYIDYADVLFSSRFPEDFDFFRVPLYPLALKIAFFVLGKNAMAVIATGSVFGFLGVWLLGSAIRQLGHPVLAAMCIVGLSFFPALIGYEHSALTEAGTFMFLALLVRVLLWSPAKASATRKTAMLVLVIAGGYYFRQSILYLAPIAAVFFFLWLLKAEAIQTGRPLRRLGLRPICRALPHFFAVAIVPFVLAWPWEQGAPPQGATGLLVSGLVRQAVIPPDHPALGNAASVYREAIEKASKNGALRISGIDWDKELAVRQMVTPAYAGRAGGLFLSVVLDNPGRYLGGVWRWLLAYVGFAGSEGENHVLREAAFNAEGAKIFPGPQKLDGAVRESFGARSTRSLVSSFLRLLMPVFDLLVALGFVATAVLFAWGIAKGDVSDIVVTGVPGAFLAMHLLLLQASDRYAFPTYPVLLINLAILTHRLVLRFRRMVREHAAIASGPSEDCRRLSVRVE